MQKYCVVEKMVTIGAGEKVSLSKDQHRRRKLYVSPRENEAKAGVYTLNKPMAFKFGEEFECDFELDPPKSVLSALEKMDEKGKSKPVIADRKERKGDANKGTGDDQ